MDASLVGQRSVVLKSGSKARDLPIVKDDHSSWVLDEEQNINLLITTS